jgi:hypothetical protein
MLHFVFGLASFRHSAEAADGTLGSDSQKTWLHRLQHMGPYCLPQSQGQGQEVHSRASGPVVPAGPGSQLLILDTLCPWAGASALFPGPEMTLYSWSRLRFTVWGKAKCQEDFIYLPSLRLRTAVSPVSLVCRWPRGQLGGRVLGLLAKGKKGVGEVEEEKGTQLRKGVGK